MEKLYTTKDMEEIFQVSRFTLINWREKGMPVIKIGTTVRYDLDAVKEWVENQNKEEVK